MNNLDGFLFTVVSSNGIPNGCYSVKLYYGDECRAIGHMKKNTTPHIGDFFLVGDADISLSMSNKINIEVYRRPHSYDKDVLFATTSISVPNPTSNRDSITQELSLKVVLSEFQEVACSITVQIQLIFKDSVFQTSDPMQHKPLFMYTEVNRAVVLGDDWKSCYLCHVVFPNGDLFSTKPLYGVNPLWAAGICLPYDPKWIGRDVTVTLYKKKHSVLQFLGKGSFKLQTTGDITTVCVPLHGQKEADSVFIKLQLGYCCTSCSRKQNDSIVFPELSSMSAENRSPTSTPINMKPSSETSSPFRFVKKHKSFK